MKIINILEGILLAITIYLIIICITLVNSHFIIHVLDINNYYDIIYNNIKNDMSNYDSNLTYNLDIKFIREDVKDYVKSYYSDNIYINRIIVNDIDIIPNEISDIYNNNIKFNKIIKNVRFKHDIIYLITIIMVILTGIIFIKTKYKHNIKFIMFISGIILIIMYGISYCLLNINIDIINKIFIKSFHYILAIGILLFEYYIFDYFMKKLNNK